jgi:hypothetical protein
MSGRVYRRGRRWWVDVTIAGRRVRRAGGRTRAAAERVMRALLGGRGGARFEDLEALVRDHYALRNRPSSQRALEVRLSRLGRAFAGLTLRELSSERITAYLRRLQGRGLAPSTVKGDAALLSHMFSLAAARGWRFERPFVPRVRASAPRQAYATRAEFDRFEAAMPAGPARAAARFAFETGWRLSSEVLPLTWAQVGPDGVRIGVDRTKGGEPRLWPRCARLDAILDAQRAAADRLEAELGFKVAFVFFDARGARLRGVGEAWCLASSTTGLELRPHDLRRSAVVHLMGTLKDPALVMRLVGHRSPGMLLAYNVVDTPRLLEAGAMLDRADQSAPAGVL